MAKNRFNFDQVGAKAKAAIALTMRDGSIEAKNHFLKSFTDGGFTDASLQKWAPRARETKRTKGKGVLIHTGALRRSIRVQVFDATHFVVVSDMGLPSGKDYAPVHNYGLRAGRKPGFTMPRRKFMGRSVVLENKIRAKLITRLNLCFK